MSPNAGEGCEDAGPQPMSTAVHMELICTPYFNLCLALSSSFGVEISHMMTKQLDAKNCNYLLAIAYRILVKRATGC